MPRGLCHIKQILSVSNKRPAKHSNGKNLYFDECITVQKKDDTEVLWYLTSIMGHSVLLSKFKRRIFIRLISNWNMPQKFDVKIKLLYVQEVLTQFM